LGKRGLEIRGDADAHLRHAEPGVMRPRPDIAGGGDLEAPPRHHPGIRATTGTGNARTASQRSRSRVMKASAAR